MTNEVSKNIWNVFKTASKAGKEATALLDLIDNKLEHFDSSKEKNHSILKEIKYLNYDAKFDESGWILVNETRTYAITPLGKTTSKYALGIQVVLYDDEPSMITEQSLLNIILQYDKSRETFEPKNWFTGDSTSDDWEGYELQSKDFTICTLTDGRCQQEGDDIIFSMPLGSLASPTDVNIKVINVIEALLKSFNPNSGDVIDAIAKAKDIINLKEYFPEQAI